MVGRRPFASNYFKKHDISLTEIPALDLRPLWNKKGVSYECKVFVSQLLDILPSQRLGGRKGQEELRAHPWLRNCDWIGVHNLAHKSLYRPSSKFRFDVGDPQIQTILANHRYHTPISEEEQTR